VVHPGWDGKGPVDLYLTTATYGAPVLRAYIEEKLLKVGAPAARVPNRGKKDKKSSPVMLTVEVDNEVIGGDEFEIPVGFYYTAPANLVLFIMINGLVASVAILELRRRGISKRLLATPASTWELFIALAAGPFQVMVAQAAFLIASTWIAFDVPWGDPLALLLVTGSLVCLGVAASMCMGTVFGSVDQALSFSPLIGTVVGMLGGCMWPLAIVPGAMQDFGHLFPSAWALDAYISLIFQKGGVGEVLPSVAVLMSMALAVGAIAVYRLRREFARQSFG
jgi:ABC-2 type transport system permease protein